MCHFPLKHTQFFFLIHLNFLPPTAPVMLTNVPNAEIFLLPEDSSVADGITQSGAIGGLLLLT